jgi:hypothetical protein
MLVGVQQARTTSYWPPGALFATLPVAVISLERKVLGRTCPGTTLDPALHRARRRRGGAMSLSGVRWYGSCVSFSWHELLNRRGTTIRA